MSAAERASEYDAEPVPGLPEELPEGERILWQGAPSWRGLARRALHTRKVAVYFALLVGWRISLALTEGLAPLAAVASASTLAALALVAVALLAGIAWLSSRATVYTITNRRVVIRFGVALTLAVNLPFRAIEAAGLRAYADGTGDIPLALDGMKGLGYAMLWPHARPWRFGNRCQPMLRSLPDVAQVAEILSDALAAAAAPAVRALPPAPEPDRSGLRVVHGTSSAA